MSASALHNYEQVFPEPHSFIPDRWLEGDVDLKRRYWVPFGRGSRACIGISLAYVELYHVIAAIFRPNGRKSFPAFFTSKACVGAAAGPKSIFEPQHHFLLSLPLIFESLT